MMALYGYSTPPGLETVGSALCANSVSGTDDRRQSRVGSVCCCIRSRWTLRLCCSGRIGVVERIGAPACSGCVANGWM